MSGNVITQSQINCDTIVPNVAFGPLGFLASGKAILDSGTANQINAKSRFTGSANSATNHLYTGATPDYCDTCVTGTATATSYGTFTATQVTPAMTSAAAYIAFAVKS